MNNALQSNPPAASQTEGRQTAIAVNIELAGLLLLPPGLQVLQNMVKADLQRALDAQHLLAILAPAPENGFQPRQSLFLDADVNAFYALCIVSDFRQALLTVAEELKRTCLFDHAEIGWFCSDEMIWRRFHPKTDASLFRVKLLDSVESRIVNKKLLATLAWYFQYFRPPAPLP